MKNKVLERPMQNISGIGLGLKLQLINVSVWLKKLFYFL